MLHRVFCFSKVFISFLLFCNLLDHHGLFKSFGLLFLLGQCLSIAFSICVYHWSRQCTSVRRANDQQLSLLLVDHHTDLFCTVRENAEVTLEVQALVLLASGGGSEVLHGLVKRNSVEECGIINIHECHVGRQAPVPPRT